MTKKKNINDFGDDNDNIYQHNTYNEDDDIDDNIDDDFINDDYLDIPISYIDDDDNLIDNSDDDDEPKNKKKSKIQKPKLIGKHSLNYDTIFKGKKNEVLDDDSYESEYIIKNAGGSLDILDDGLEMEESHNSTEYYISVRLKQEIYKALSVYTDIDFSSNRRKPAKTDFNAYFALLIKELFNYGYTKTEIFIELSGYFSDNIWNMFKLLDKQYSNIIINELREKKGLKEIDQINWLDV